MVEARAPLTTEEEMSAGNHQPVSQLSPSDPASLFISYARHDEQAILPLEQALKERGIRVIRDRTHLPLGRQNVAYLTSLIDQGCDAILLFVTESFLRSQFIWKYEVPAALARQRRQPSFGIIPVISGMSFQDVAIYCTDQGLPSLADFNAELIGHDVPSQDEVRRVAFRTLQATLSLRQARGGTHDRVITLCLRTFPYTPPSPTLYLDMDWTEPFEASEASPEYWGDALFPALSDVTRVLAQQRRSNIVEAWLKARLPVAVALGHACPLRGSLRLRLRNDFGLWACDGPSDEPAGFLVTTTKLNQDTKSAVVEVPISREVAPAVTTWRTNANVTPRFRVRCAPTAGPSRVALATDAQARSWAQRIGTELRSLWDQESVDEVHVFLASSVEFAVMVGQQLRDRRPVHVYYGDNELGYRLAYTLPSRSL